MATRLATKYSDAMKEQSWGHALFRPARSSVLQPGSCGYLDDNGKWHPVIANIENPPQDSPLPFSKPGRLSAMPPETHTWGPKSATDGLHKCVAFSAAADALAAGFPAEVQMALEFSSAKDFGAVLHCAHDVEERGYYFHEPFAQWAKKNAQALLQHCPDIKSHGVWIIKSTVETRDVNICACSGRSKTVSMGFKVAIPAAGEIGPSGEFVKDGSADEWHHDSSDNRDDRLVVFFTGVFLRYRWLALGRKSLKEIRGDELVVVQDPIDPDDYYEVSCQITDGGSQL